MTEFKVGDTVRFIESYDGIPTGTKAIVTEVLPNALYVDLLDGVKNSRGRDHSIYAFTHRFALVPQNKFAVGDYVRVVEGSYELELGTIGRVTQTHPNNYGGGQPAVTVDLLYGAKTPGGLAENLYYFEKRFEKYTPSELEKSGLKAGDRVLIEGNGLHNSGKTGVILGTSFNFIKVEVDGDDYLYEASEVSLAPAPKPERVFQPGDWVEVHGHSNTWDGTVVQVKATNAWFTELYNEFFVETSNADHEALAFRESVLRKTDAPAPFKEGDWVKVTNFAGGMSEGLLGQYQHPCTGWGLEGWHRIKTEAGSPRQFPLENLVAAEAPKLYEDFKVGDWAEIVQFKGNRPERYIGVKGVVTEVREVGWDKESGPHVKIEAIEDGREDQRCGNEIILHADRYKKIDAPVEKSWVEELPVGTFGVTKTFSGTVNRILHKTGGDKWTVQYGRPQLDTVETDKYRLNNPVSLRDNSDVEGIIGDEKNLILV